jgi:hypothetical protein
MLRKAVASDIAAIQRVRGSVRENRLVSTVITDDDVRRAMAALLAAVLVEIGDVEAQQLVFASAAGHG